MIKKYAEFIKENYGNRTPDEVDEIECLAIRHFGTTDNFKIGGYIMRDGTILDFSESNVGSDGMDRYADHRYISHITIDHETDEYISDIEEPDIWEFMDLGNIRINFPSGFDLAQPMTPAQKRVVRRYIQTCARNSRNGFYVTIFKEGKTQKYFEYNMIYADDVDNIMQDIDDYFDSYK